MTPASAEPEPLFAAKGRARPAVAQGQEAEPSASSPPGFTSAEQPDATDAVAEQEMASVSGGPADGGLVPAGSLASSHIARSARAAALSESPASAANDDVESSETRPSQALGRDPADGLANRGIEQSSRILAMGFAVLGLILVLLMVWYSLRESPTGATSQTQSGEDPPPPSRLTVAKIASGSGDYLPSGITSAQLSGASRDRADGQINQSDMDSR